jgi:hypothetical protein
MAELPPELAPPAPVTQPGQTGLDPNSLTPTADAMQVGVEDALGDFITMFVRLMETKGIDMDEAMNLSPEDEADILEDGDPTEFLSIEEMTMLVEKFVLIPEPQRSEIGQQMAAVLPPKAGNRLAAIIRKVEGRDIQQQAAP